MKTLSVTSFGAAFAAMYTATDLQAAISSFGWSFNSISEGVLGSFVAADIGGGFSAWNGGTNAVTVATGGFDQLAIVNFGDNISTAAFINSGYTNVPTSTGTAYVGFSFLGNFGWFQVTIDDLGIMSWGPGYWDADGGAISAGQIPAPGALGLLALGALGVRRSRARAA